MIEEPNVNVHDLFFDSSGKQIDRMQFYKRYPDGRKMIARDAVLGLAVSTEFVGINHNSDADGAPWIYETVVQVDGEVVYSKWSSHARTAVAEHVSAAWRVRLGGAVWWRARNYYQRARHALRRAL